MSLLTKLLLLTLPALISTSTYPDDFKKRENRLTNIQHLARTERDLIHKLIDIKEQYPDPEQELEFFLEFLLEDAGYPFEDTVEDTVQYPLERFKIVERFVYDWPMISEAVDSLEVEHGVDVMAEFIRNVPEVPTFTDLTEIVRELNEVVVVSGESPTGLLPDDTEFNTGNFMILTNISHALGHVKMCVQWGDLADNDLILSEEPFTIPGEEHWLTQYMVYYECLVKLGDNIKAKVVKDEILQYYSDREDIKTKIKAISRGNGDLEYRDSELDACIELSDFETQCHVDWSDAMYYPNRYEQIVGTPIILERGVRNNVSLRASPYPSEVIVLDNSRGNSAVRLVTVGKGTIVIDPGDALHIPPALISRVCTPSHGAVPVYSV